MLALIEDGYQQRHCPKAELQQPILAYGLRVPNDASSSKKRLQQLALMKITCCCLCVVNRSRCSYIVSIPLLALLWVLRLGPKLTVVHTISSISPVHSKTIPSKVIMPMPNQVIMANGEFV